MNKEKLEFKTNLLLGIFVSLLIAANLIGSKITHIWKIDFSVGIFTYPFTFLITDIIEEVHGKKRTKQFILVGFVCLVMVLLLTAFSVALPFAERSHVRDDYTRVFSFSLRILVASIVAFLISQFHDVWAFNFWKQKTKGRFLWLRNNASTIVSQFIDTSIFMFIAFYQATPKFTVSYLFALIIPYWLLKVVVAIFDTPFCYLGVKWLKK